MKLVFVKPGGSFDSNGASVSEPKSVPEPKFLSNQTGDRTPPIKPQNTPKYSDMR